MRIGVIGAGRIGGNIGKLLAQAGHEVLFSFSRDQAKLQALADDAGAGAQVGTPAEAAAFGDLIVVSVPWALVDKVLAEAGSLDGKIVIDTTNPYTAQGRQPLPEGMSAAQVNAEKVPNARWVKAYNTLTAGFQATSAGRTGSDRVVLFYAGDNSAAKQVVADLIADSGFEPVDVGSLAIEDVGHMEPKGELYGEEFHLTEARELVATLRGTAPSGTGRG